MGILEAFFKVFRPFLVSFGLYFRFQSQGRQNRLSTHPPGVCSGYVHWVVTRRKWLKNSSLPGRLFAPM